MKYFYYAGELFLCVTPGKTLFHSTMVHEVVNRGDVFVVRVSDSILTILPRWAMKDAEELEIVPPRETPDAMELLQKVKLDLGHKPPFSLRDKVRYIGTPEQYDATVVDMIEVSKNDWYVWITETEHDDGARLCHASRLEKLNKEQL